MFPARLLAASCSLLLLAGCADTPSDQALDETVTHSIRQHSALLADPTLRVRSVDGVVYLYGLVATYVEYAEVEKVAQAAVPTHQVVNLTTIENVQR